MKRLYKRVFAAVLVCLALLANCTPFLSVAFATDVSSALSVSFGDDWASGDNADDLLSLAGLSYFASNGVNMVSYNQTGETLVDTYMKYYKQFYEEQIVQAGATSDFYSWIANSITENALGIQRVAGAVTGAAKILIGEPLAQILNPFLNWFNNKFNPSDSTAEQTVEITRDTAVAAVTVPYNNSSFVLTILKSGGIFSYSGLSFTSSSSPFFYRYASFDRSSVALGNSFQLSFGGNIVEFSRVSFKMVSRSSGGSNYYVVQFSVDDQNWYDLAGLSADSCYGFLFGSDSGVLFGYSSPVVSVPGSINESSVFGPIPYSYFYSTSDQFDDSGVSVLTTSVSSDGSLSYGPDTSSADNIVQNSQTLAVPVIAPSLSGDASLSFETTDTLAELLEKALSSVQAALSDASANTLELPSNDDTLPPEIEILDDDDITWADDSVAEVTPTPTPGAVVTVGPSPVVTPWPVSDPQLAVVGSDGQSTLVDVVQTIKGWTSSLTDVYQMYVNLISALFPFLPDELIVLLNWSLSALIFTGLFKRWWWSHH